MHEDRPNLRRVHCRIQSLRRNLLHLMIPAIQRLSKTPAAASCQRPIFRDSHKVSPIRNQLTIYREHRRQRAFSLCRRIITHLQPPNRSFNQRANRRNIIRSCNSQMKSRHRQSIEAEPSPESSQPLRNTVVTADFLMRNKSPFENRPAYLVRPPHRVLHSSPWPSI